MKLRRMHVGMGAVILVGALWATSAQATLELKEVSVDPGATVTLHSPPLNVTIGAEAGIYNISINNGAPVQSFCIDPGRYSSSANMPYEVYSLQAAPLSPSGPMGAGAAIMIERLWNSYFTLAQGSGFQAAALQSAIWYEIGIGAGYGAPPPAGFGNELTINGFTFAGAASQANTTVEGRAHEMIDNVGTGRTALMALVNETGGDKYYQSYVVPVPEPTTMIAGALLLLPFGASTLRLLRRRA